MKVKIAPNDIQSMSQDGDAILRSLQNKNLNIVDLMVRESLQNSLDATLPTSDITEVDFNVGQFDSKSLASHLEGIEYKLSTEFPGQNKFLSISDKNTSGLTGDFETNNAELLEKSNFQKLVFGIGKNQIKEGSGGSWGLGKTSYFRIGNGIVIYYSRVMTNLGFEERLIASLIESPKSANRLHESCDRGIAWWGEYGEKDPLKILPLTKGSDISEILDIFDLTRYQDEETGTTIIVPYLKELDMVSEDEEEYPWEKTYGEAIQMSVQRWYSPRILNTTYSEVVGNSMLFCKVNGESINDFNMEPTFKLFQELYNSALTGKPTDDYIIVNEINELQKVMKNSDRLVGRIAFCEVSREMLQMTSPNNKRSGLSYLGIKNNEKIKKNISKVIAYSRKPGMIVEYNIDGKWAPSEIVQSDDHMLFGFFVPNSSGELIDHYQKLNYRDLEMYLRGTESADHANWIDDAGITIVDRIIKYTSKTIKEQYQEDSDEGLSSATSGLSRKYGSILMPPRNFGKMSRGGVKSTITPKEVSKKTRLSDIVIMETKQVTESRIDLTFQLFVKGNKEGVRTSEVIIQLLTQEHKINKLDWSNAMDVNMQFPISMNKVYIESINMNPVNITLSNYSSEEFDMEFKNDNYGTFKVKSKTKIEAEIIGTIELQISSNKYLPMITVSTYLESSEESKE